MKIRVLAFGFAMLATLSISPTAMACSPNLPNYQSCVQQQQHHFQEQNRLAHERMANDYYGQPTYSSPRYRHKYVELLWTKQDEPYFFQTTKSSRHPNFFDDSAFTTGYIHIEALDECNQSNKRRPCQYSQGHSSVANYGCIGYVRTPKALFSYAGNGCMEAREKVFAQCLAAHNNDAAICKETEVYEVGASRRRY